MDWIMGSLCSSVDKDAEEPPESKAQGQVQLHSNTHRRLHKMPQPGMPVRAKTFRSSIDSQKISSVKDYNAARAALIQAEKDTAFDAETIATASAIEKKANDIVRGIRNYDWDHTYHMPPSSKRVCPVSGDIIVERTAGEHFLGNVNLINQTELFKVAKKMPKGAHLHIHFNSCLSPKFLIQEARDLPTMYISSSLPLTKSADFHHCRIQFMVFNEEKVAAANVTFDEKIPVDQRPGEVNIFSPNYVKFKWMKYKAFQEKFDWMDNTDNTHYKGIDKVEDWLEKKMFFWEDEVHAVNQTGRGIWEKFNYRTQMMKGLFAYESAYRNYTKACIKDFVDDNIQYAEVRPNFMRNNQLKTDCGGGEKSNEQIMEILSSGVQSAMDEIKQEGHYFGDMKVIYCTPRSFKNDAIEYCLNECIALKKKFPKLICGFDLVGHEEMGFELNKFIPEFLAFRQKCNQENLDIPFLFHCGETLQVGDKIDGNLFDAVLLNAKRVGHGYALARHPLLIKMFKDKGIAIESCPISNEVLGLTSTIAGHHLPILLANDVPCTINSDNATFYQSSLSHDFYQVMIGSEDMSLLGWKQLAKWSLEHSCMDEVQKKEVTAVWQQKWDEYCQWIVDTYSDKLGYEHKLDLSRADWVAPAAPAPTV